MNFETIIQKHIQDHFPIYKNIVHSLYENPELGMEALHELKVVDFPAIIAAAHNKSIY